MGIDRVTTTLPTYRSLQRRGRTRKGKGSSEDDLADESSNHETVRQSDRHAADKRAASESDENEGHIDEHV